MKRVAWSVIVSIALSIASSCNDEGRGPSGDGLTIRVAPLEYPPPGLNVNRLPSAKRRAYTKWMNESSSGIAGCLASCKMAWMTTTASSELTARGSAYGLSRVVIARRTAGSGGSFTFGARQCTRRRRKYSSDGALT